MNWDKSQKKEVVENYYNASRSTFKRMLKNANIPITRLHYIHPADLQKLKEVYG